MAFLLSGWARVAAGTYDDSVVVFAYDTPDSIATITAAGYFDTAPQVGGNDVIISSASDGM